MSYWGQWEYSVVCHEITQSSQRFVINFPYYGIVCVMLIRPICRFSVPRGTCPLFNDTSLRLESNYFQISYVHGKCSSSGEKSSSILFPLSSASLRSVGRFHQLIWNRMVLAIVFRVPFLNGRHFTKRVFTFGYIFFPESLRSVSVIFNRSPSFHTHPTNRS